LPVSDPVVSRRAKVVVGASAQQTNSRFKGRCGSDAGFCKVSSPHRITERVLFLWKHEITPATVTFATVEIIDASQ
jgi:hypothetical protein